MHWRVHKHRSILSCNVCWEQQTCKSRLNIYIDHTLASLGVGTSIRTLGLLPAHISPTVADMSPGLGFCWILPESARTLNPAAPVSSLQNLLDGGNVQAPDYSRAVRDLGLNLRPVTFINVGGEEVRPPGSSSFYNQLEAEVGVGCGQRRRASKCASGSHVGRRGRQWHVLGALLCHRTLSSMPTRGMTASRGTQTHDVLTSIDHTRPWCPTSLAGLGLHSVPDHCAVMVQLISAWQQHRRLQRRCWLHLSGQAIPLMSRQAWLMQTSTLWGVKTGSSTRSAVCTMGYCSTSCCTLLHMQPQIHTSGHHAPILVCAQTVAKIVKQITFRHKQAFKKGLVPRALSIGIVTPYSQQVLRIASLLRPAIVDPSRGHRNDRAFSWAENGVEMEVRSVDGFQGRETDIIILSTVRCNPYGNLGHVHDNRCVAMAELGLWGSCA